VTREVSKVKGEATAADRTNVASRSRARQDHAISRTLELADAAAARGDYVDALAWLGTLEAIGHQLDSVYENRCARWRLEVEAGRAGCSQWFG
jgi:hypothetical protein